MEDTAGPLAVIGGGTMAMAIIQGGIAAGVLAAGQIGVAEPDGGKRAGLARLGVAVFASAGEVVGWLEQAERAAGAAGQVLLAVKPQSLGEVGREIGGRLGGGGGGGGRRRVVISILAGTPTARVREVLGDVAVVRAMPNTPARIRRGVTAIAVGEGAGEADAEFARRVFAGVGQLVVTIGEEMMDAFTAVAGSGPAYVFYLAQAMVEAAVAVGFDRAMALRVVQETVAGAGALLAEEDKEPAVLLAGVMSKGGTTEAAARVLEGRGVSGAVVEAIVAARDRGVELGRGAGR